MRLPHPLVLLVGCIAVAAALTWVLPAGEYDRHVDAATGRTVVEPGTYHRVEAAPVGPFAAVVSIPRGLIEGADVIALVLLVGAAWVIVERVGTLGRAVRWLVARFHGRGLWAIPVVALLFAVMGGLENMQEEIIPLVPVLLILGAGLGVDAVAVLAISVGAAAIGSAFSPINPFQAGIALKLAELPLLSGAGLRVAMWVAAVTLWILWTIRYARKNRTAVEPVTVTTDQAMTGKHWLMLLMAVLPMAAYVYGALRLDWGFNELSAGFVISGVVIGLRGGLRVGGTTVAFLEGMQSLLPAAVLIGVARSISLVLADGRVIDTILHALAQPLGQVPAMASALLMIPFHAMIHVPVPSVSGHAALTMPVVVPLADLLQMSRQVPVLAYQTGAGLTELLTPTNGALMAVLLAATVPYGTWVKFAIGGVLLALGVGIAGIGVALM
jgi:uncharacterized ion transporter superfamily protein YfcC